MAFDFSSHSNCRHRLHPRRTAKAKYFWNGSAWMMGSGVSTPVDAEARYVNTDGDVMTGPLTLNGDPVDALHAATRQYVDALVATMRQ